MSARPTYGRLVLQDGRWTLADIPPHVALRLKSMFPRIPKSQTMVFDLPASPEISADLHWFMQRYPLDIGEADRLALDLGKERFEDDRAKTEAIMLPDWQPPGRAGFRPGLDAYHMQKQAAEVLLRRRSLLIGDDVGLGKTITALYALSGSQFLPAAIVVQAHLPSQWVEEFILPFTYMSAHVIDGTTPYSLPTANLYIFKYSNIAGWSDIAATGLFKAVVYDEIQELRRGTETEKGKAAMVFSDNAHLKVGLSATPIFNFGGEIWNVLQYLDPEVLGTHEDFTREWCRYGGNGKWIVNDPDALGSYMRESGVFIRRVREGRPINRIPVEVDFDQEVADEAAELARKLAMKVLGGDFLEAGQAARELDAFARLQTGLAKADSVAALVRMYVEAGEPILLAGWHREVYSRWLTLLGDLRPAFYTGKETAKQKDATKRKFVSGETDLMIISLRSGAGLDGLQKRCSTVIVGELDWSPAVIEQLLGRVDRPGQPKDEITAIFPFVQYGSDPTLMQVNAIKKDQQRGINDPGLQMPPVYSDQSRMKMLAESFLGGR